ncbi:uncharacterized protein LOC113758055 isoform X3 [Coffea eugenioides]|uniref:uncharacterized protein LOC113758055 isoform X3 n=1 Tax=Coffea eugenioides TaxID=49369 RepID=UPI000F6058A5|nr:uncharacterized protein LOC113758055 isoform X3 [Coffea eugenioides]
MSISICHSSLTPNSTVLLIPTKNPQLQSLRNQCLRLSILKVSAASRDRNLTSSSPPLPTTTSTGDILQNLAVSFVLFLGLGFGIRALPASACTRLPPVIASVVNCQFQECVQSVVQLVQPKFHSTFCPDRCLVSDLGDVKKSENLEEAEADELKAAFERWKSKTYALSVPLRVVALRNSLPSIWFQEFIQSQGKRVKLQPEFRQNLMDIFSELCQSNNKVAVSPKSAMAADVVTLGDSWLSFAIKEGLIQPIQGVEEQDWFRDLTEDWKGYLHRSTDGNLDPQGKIWAVPYRWGSLVIAYKKSKFLKHKLAPIVDWADLWRPELAGKISMVDSPREIVGAVLKYMGASYNTHNITSQVAGGKSALKEKLALFAKQAIPATSRVKTGNVGGRVRGPSPLVSQWIEFCLQSARALSFKEEAIPGALPIVFQDPVQGSGNLHKGQPKLETNLVACMPPPDILARCEFLEPLPEDTMADYQWLIANIKKPKQSVMQTLQHYILLIVRSLLAIVQSKGGITS